ncbi:unnamed protein product [Urochloa humidicola]
MKLLRVLSPVLLLTSMVVEPAASVPITQCYDSIFNFGDSFADTGNDIVVGRPRRALDRQPSSSASLRHDLLRLPHRPQLQRPPHHRLHR